MCAPVFVCVLVCMFVGVRVDTRSCFEQGLTQSATVYTRALVNLCMMRSHLILCFCRLDFFLSSCIDVLRSWCISVFHDVCMCYMFCIAQVQLLWAFSCARCTAGWRIGAETRGGVGWRTLLRLFYRTNWSHGASGMCVRADA